MIGAYGCKSNGSREKELHRRAVHEEPFRGAPFLVRKGAGRRRFVKGLEEEHK